MIETTDLWASLPIPAILIDAGDTIQDLNGAAEGFLNASLKAIKGTPVWDILAVDAPLEEPGIDEHHGQIGGSKTLRIACSEQQA